MLQHELVVNGLSLTWMIWPLAVSVRNEAFGDEIIGARAPSTVRMRDSAVSKVRECPDQIVELLVGPECDAS